MDSADFLHLGMTIEEAVIFLEDTEDIALIPDCDVLYPGIYAERLRCKEIARISSGCCEVSKIKVG